MTELSPVSHCVPDGVDLDVATVGRLLPNMEAMIVDPATGAELPPGERGELWCRGPNVMAGYLNDPAATAATLDRDGWLHTGDLVTSDADGVFTVVDRIRELIKYKVWSVAPAELEAVLLSRSGWCRARRCAWWSSSTRSRSRRPGRSCARTFALARGRPCRPSRPRDRSEQLALLTRRSGHQLDDDVKLTHVAGVLLQHVEQHPLQRRGLRAPPPRPWLSSLTQSMGLDDAPTARPLLPKLIGHLGQTHVGGYMPTPVLLVRPRVAHVQTQEAPLQPPPLHVPQMHQQLQR